MPRNSVQKCRARRWRRRAAASELRFMKVGAGALMLVIAAMVTIAACTTRTEKARDIHDELIYFKDHRTDKCFAYWMVEGETRTGVMAGVSCDEKVERLLVNGAESPAKEAP